MLPFHLHKHCAVAIVAEGLHTLHALSAVGLIRCLICPSSVWLGFGFGTVSVDSRNCSAGLWPFGCVLLYRNENKGTTPQIVSSLKNSGNETSCMNHLPTSGLVSSVKLTKGVFVCDCSPKVALLMSQKQGSSVIFPDGTVFLFASGFTSHLPPGDNLTSSSL